MRFMKVHARHAAPRPAEKPAPMPHLTRAQAKETFQHLDRNKDGFIDAKDLTTRAGAQVTKLPGDRNHDLRLSEREFRALGARAPETHHHSSAGQPTRSFQHVFHLPKHSKHEATIRTHASGLVLGRLQRGDTFITTHQKGEWVFGHVKGHPDREGWVLRGSLGEAKRAPTPHELAEGSRHARDLRKEAGLDYMTGKDKQVIQALQEHLTSGPRIGFTTRVPVKDGVTEVKLYANYPMTAGSRLKGKDGTPLSLDPNKAVHFRYTPDGKHAVVFVPRKGNSGLWAICDLNVLDLRSKPMGSQAPAHAIRHG